MLMFPGQGSAEEAGKKVFPQKAESDKNFDGKVDHVEHYQDGMVVRVEDDSDFNGTFDEWTTYQDGKPVKTERDTNADGKPDSWIHY